MMDGDNGWVMANWMKGGDVGDGGDSDGDRMMMRIWLDNSGDGGGGDDTIKGDAHPTHLPRIRT